MRQPMLRSAALVAILVLGLRAGPARGEGAGGELPPVVFMTDFGTADDAVAICKGVMLGLAPRLRIVDLTHEVTPYSIRDGARLLVGPTPYYPAGTVFLAVVDPGVGGERRAIVAKSRRGQYFVLPDNGLLSLVADRDGLEEVRQITNPAWMRAPTVTPTFHGRDIFSPVAARIARGDDWRDVGPLVADPVRLDVVAPSRTAEGVSGEAVALDGRFGNVLTNIEGSELAALGWAAGDRVGVRIGTRELMLPFVRTFGEVPEGAPLLYIDSRDHVALAVNRGHFAKTYGVAVPVSVVVERKPDAPKEKP